MDTEIKFVGSFFYSFFRISRWFQSQISLVFWTLFVSPTLMIAKLLHEKGHSKLEQKHDAFIVLNMQKPHQRCLLGILGFLFKVNSMLSGVVGNDKVYAKLLTWNRDIPLIGFRADKTTFTIQLLKEKVENGWSIDFTWLTSHAEHGIFKIVEVKSNDKNKSEVVLECVWLSGEDAGKVFEVGRFSFLSAMSGQKENILSSIYYPPKLLIFLLEIIISGTAIIAFIQFTQDGWIYIGKTMVMLLGQILEYLSNAFRMIQSLLR